MPAITSLSLAAMRRLMRLAQALKNRRKANLLTRFDDRMLADIGLTRSDVRDAYAEPLWHDPTDILARRAAERRTRRVA
jgi:uncharacterized protein YjiS (DUF1127 family)